MIKSAGKIVYDTGNLHKVKSDFTKQKIKNVANKYLDQALDSLSSDVSKKTSLLSGAIDIHKMIGKLPKPKVRFTPSKYKYMVLIIH